MVINDEPVSLRRLQPGVPRDLETICLKCLQKDPRRRYASALALAQDLARFLAGEPVHARPIGYLEALAKWARRRPTAAALIGVSGLAALALIVLGAVDNTRLQHSNNALAAALTETTEAKARAEDEHARAQAHLTKALEVIDHMLTHLWDEPLGNSAPVLALRRRLLQEARDYYEWNLQRNDQDPAVRRETARACFRTAGLHLWLGETREAEDFSNQAIKLQNQLCADFPDNLDYRHDLSQTFAYQGHIQSMKGRFDAALAAYNKAIALTESLAMESPANPKYQQTWANTLNHMALLETYVSPAQAETNFQKAINIGQSLVREHPNAADYQCLLANAYANLVMNRDRGDQVSGMVEPVQKGLALLEPTGKEPPKTGQDYVRGLAVLKLYGGIVHLRRRHFQQAEPSLKAGIQGLEELTKFAPIFPYRFQLAMSYPRLAQLYEETKRDSLAEENYRKSLDTIEQLMKDFPSLVFLKSVAIDRRILLMVYPARRGLNLDKLVSEVDALTAKSGLNAGNYYNFACLFAQASLAPGLAPATVEDFQQRALRLLERVARMGFLSTPSGKQLIHADRDIDPLRQREDFKRLVEGLNKKPVAK
jgi:tetratricopeptide (TPR) repeat protein